MKISRMAKPFEISIHDIELEHLDPIEFPWSRAADLNESHAKAIAWWISAWRRVHDDDRGLIDLGGES